MLKSNMYYQKSAGMNFFFYYKIEPQKLKNLVLTIIFEKYISPRANNRWIFNFHDQYASGINENLTEYRLEITGHHRTLNIRICIFDSDCYKCLQFLENSWCSESY